MEKYKVILESQLGPREGLLQIEDENGTPTGSLTLLGYENPVSGEWTGERSFRLFHHLHTQVSDLSCVSVFEIDGNRIFGSLQNDRNMMKWHGEKILGKKGGKEKNGGK